MIELFETILPLLQATAHAAPHQDAFLPHGFCIAWNRPLLFTHVVSDVLIGGSYLVISGSLAMLVHRLRRDIPFSVMFVAFGLFIVTCGVTHLVGVWTFWEPRYWLLGYVKAVTAVASVATAAVLPMIIPRVRSTVTDAKLSRARMLAAERTAVLEVANRQLEAERARAEEANRVKTEFLAVMSHELRTPLNAITGYSELLGMEIPGPLTPGQREQLGRIRGSAEHLLGLIDQVLQVAREDSVGQVPLAITGADLGAIVDSAAATIAPVTVQQQQHLLVENDVRGVVGATDAMKVQQILHNLLSNASKFTPRGGTIVLRASATPAEIRLEVSDTGIGISQEHLDKVFEPFWQVSQGHARSAGGTGLGLNLVRRFARQLGGRVSLQSELGRGATFIVTLPLAADQTGRGA